MQTPINKYKNKIWQHNLSLLFSKQQWPYSVSLFISQPLPLSPKYCTTCVLFLPSSPHNHVLHIHSFFFTSQIPKTPNLSLFHTLSLYLSTLHSFFFDSSTPQKYSTFSTPFCVQACLPEIFTGDVNHPLFSSLSFFSPSLVWPCHMSLTCSWTSCLLFTLQIPMIIFSAHGKNQILHATSLEFHVIPMVLFQKSILLGRILVALFSLTLFVHSLH